MSTNQDFSKGISLNVVHIFALPCFTHLCLVSLFLVRQSGSGLKKKKRQEILILQKSSTFYLTAVQQ